MRLRYPKQQQQARQVCVALWCDLFSLVPSGRMSVHGDHEGGVAWRRRQRQLRMHWGTNSSRCKWPWQQALHHSRDVGPVSYQAPRSQRMEEENEMHFAVGQTAPPPRAAAAMFFPLTPSAEAGGGRHLPSRCGRRLVRRGTSEALTSTARQCCWVYLCHSRRNHWWTFSGSSTTLFPSRLSQCP